MKYLIVSLALFAASCNWAKEKTKQTVNKTGEVIGKAGSEFADGVSKGVEKTFENDVKISEQLTKQGLQTGKILINSTDSTTDNILTAYLIFNDNITREVIVKVFSPAGKEYGRARQMVKGQKGEARYVDFVFDKRTNIDGKGTIQFE
ncbi:MAG TPA: hypothetical protein VIM79_15555 [Niastella sp.]